MTTTLTIECDIHFDRKGRGSRKVLENSPRPHRPTEPGRVPRVARLMALAIRFDRLLRDGVIESYTELAALGHVTRARVSQIMNLVNLAPDIQEAILFLPRTERGRDPIHLRQLQPIAAALDWRKQRQMWREPRRSTSIAAPSACQYNIGVIGRSPRTWRSPLQKNEPSFDNGSKTLCADKVSVSEMTRLSRQEN